MENSGPTGRHGEAVAQTRDKIRQLTYIGQRLDGLVSVASVLESPEFSSQVATPLAACLSDASRTFRSWATILVLESPAVRRQLRVRLLGELSRRGVYRDLGDLPEVGSCATGAILASAARIGESRAKLIVDYVCECLKVSSARRPSTADATLLAFMLRGESFMALQRLTDDRGPFAEVVALATWLRLVDDGVARSQAPASSLARTWFETIAYRGARRRWARRRGLIDGQADASTLPDWLSPPWADPPEGFGAMVVEWTLAVIRHWPGRERAVREDSPEVAERATALRSQAEAAVRDCEGGQALASWLHSGVIALTLAPPHLRRLRRPLSYTPTSRSRVL